MGSTLRGVKLIKNCLLRRANLQELMMKLMAQVKKTEKNQNDNIGYIRRFKTFS